MPRQDSLIGVTKNDCFPRKAVVKTKSKTVVVAGLRETSDDGVLQEQDLRGP
jgi:hypothetical protein